MRGVLLLILLLAAPPSFAQTDGPTLPAPPADRSGRAATAIVPGGGELPVSLDRVRRALERPDRLRAQVGDDGRVVFRVEIEGQLPTFSAFIGRDEPLTGPSPWGPMTHSEFLAMVTPPQARPFGASINSDLLQVMATSLATAFALNGVVKAVDGVRGVIRERRSREVQEEIRQVLAELERRKQEEAEKIERMKREEDAAKKKAEGDGRGQI